MYCIIHTHVYYASSRKQNSIDKNTVENMKIYIFSDSVPKKVQEK